MSNDYTHNFIDHYANTNEIEYTKLVKVIEEDVDELSTKINNLRDNISIDELLMPIEYKISVLIAKIDACQKALTTLKENSENIDYKYITKIIDKLKFLVDSFNNMKSMFPSITK